MIYLKQCHRTGIMYINDLLDENFKFLSRDKFQGIFQLYVSFTACYGLISAIPPSWTDAQSNAQKSQLKMTTRHKNLLCLRISPPVLPMQQL